MGHTIFHIADTSQINSRMQVSLAYGRCSSDDIYNIMQLLYTQRLWNAITNSRLSQENYTRPALPRTSTATSSIQDLLSDECNDAHPLHAPDSIRPPAERGMHFQMSNSSPNAAKIDSVGRIVYSCKSARTAAISGPVLQANKNARRKGRAFL